MGLLLFGIGNGGLAMWYLDCIYDGAGAGLLGLLRVAAGAAGLVRDGALFDGPPGRG